MALVRDDDDDNDEEEDIVQLCSLICYTKNVSTLTIFRMSLRFSFNNNSMILIIAGRTYNMCVFGCVGVCVVVTKPT